MTIFMPQSPIWNALKRTFFHAVIFLVAIVFVCNCIHLCWLHTGQKKPLYAYYSFERSCAESVLAKIETNDIERLKKRNVWNQILWGYACKITGNNRNSLIGNDTFMVVKKMLYLAKAKDLDREIEFKKRVDGLTVKCLLYDFRRYIVNFLTIIGLFSITCFGLYTYQDKESENDIRIHAYLILSILVWGIHGCMRLYQVHCPETELLTSFLNNTFLLWALPHLPMKDESYSPFILSVLLVRKKWKGHYIFNLIVGLVHLLCFIYLIINAHTDTNSSFDTVLTSVSYFLFGIVIYYILKIRQKAWLNWLVLLSVTATISANVLGWSGLEQINFFNDYFYAVSNVIYNAALFFIIFMLFYSKWEKIRKKRTEELKEHSTIVSHRVMTDFTTLKFMLHDKKKELTTYKDIDKDDMVLFLKEMEINLDSMRELHKNIIQQPKGDNYSDLQLSQYLKEVIEINAEILPLSVAKCEISLPSRSSFHFSQVYMIGSLIHNLLLNLYHYVEEGQLVDLLIKEEGDSFTISVYYTIPSGKRKQSMSIGRVNDIAIGLGGKTVEGKHLDAQYFCTVVIPFV